MKRRAILLVLSLLVTAATAASAADANLGTWKLNQARSKLRPGAPKNNTVVYERAGDKVKITVDGVTGDGKPLHSEWIGRFDGKDYSVTGDPSEDTRSYKKTGPRTMLLTIKKNSKVTKQGRITLAPDGKSRTVELHGTGSTGKRFTNLTVYDKQ